MEKVTIGNSMYYNTSPSGKEVLKEQGKPQEKVEPKEEGKTHIPCSCH